MLEDLKAAFPDYARDTKLNLGSVLSTSELSTQQMWGSALAVAFVGRNSKVLREVVRTAREFLTDEAIDAAKAAASIMSMNNIYYRAKYLLSDPEYAYLTPKLRMQVIGNSGVEKTDFTLWCFAVSAVAGCPSCLDSHEKELREAGLTREAIHDALRIAAVVYAAAVTLDSEGSLADMDRPVGQEGTVTASDTDDTPIYTTIKPSIVANKNQAWPEEPAIVVPSETEGYSWWNNAEIRNDDVTAVRAEPSSAASKSLTTGSAESGRDNGKTEEEAGEKPVDVPKYQTRNSTSTTLPSPDSNGKNDNPWAVRVPKWVGRR